MVREIQVCQLLLMEECLRVHDGQVHSWPLSEV